jgi:UDP-sugar transporter A1/2/3
MLGLCALVFQNTAVVILLKVSVRAEALPYATSTVVLVSEGVKLCICASITYRQSWDHFRKTIAAVKDQKLLFLPSLLYVAQNNLLLFGAKRLPPLVYVVCTQTKVLTTAVFSRILLGTRLSILQCASLLLLVVGVSTVQQEESQLITLQGAKLREHSLGLVAVLLASLTSGIAGVTLEKVFKQSKQLENIQIENNVWTRNLQLSLISLPFALVGVYLRDKQALFDGDFFAGYDSVVWCIVATSAGGGIITGFVMKYANNILKCLAIAISICLCAAYSVFTCETALSRHLIFGVLTVIISVCMYSLYPFRLEQTVGKNRGERVSKLNLESRQTSKV